MIEVPKSKVRTKITEHESFFCSLTPEQVVELYEIAKNTDSLLRLPLHRMGKDPQWIYLHHNEFRSVEDYV